MNGSAAPGAASQLADGTAAGSWVLDPAGSAAEFRVRHFWGAITVRGTLGPMAGEAVVSPDGTVAGRISFDARSLDTGHKQRDKHLRYHLKGTRPPKRQFSNNERTRCSFWQFLQRRWNPAHAASSDRQAA
jgi:YceI-like domain